MRTLLATWMFGALFSFAACAPPGTELDEDEVEIEESRESEIIGGSQATTFPEAVLIDMKVGNSVVSICSGAAIAPNLILTAGHCVHGFDGWNVKAPFANNQTAKGVRAETFDWDSDGSIVDPNQHDVGVIFLDKPIQLAAYPTLADKPVALNSKVQNIGRIDNGTASNTKLFIGPPVTVKSGSSYGYPLSYATSETIQSGDSGGPVIVPGTRKIVAVNSGAGGGIQVLARTDLVSTWLKAKLAEAGTATPPPPADPCGGLTFAGRCATSKLVEWCENGKKQQLACTGTKKCGWDAGPGYYNCIN
jgi:hypothetical protein